MPTRGLTKLIGIGLLAGVFSALFGVGGGIVIVPLLVVFRGFNQRRAAATSLAAILVSSIAGVVTYAFHGDVKPGAAALVGDPRSRRRPAGNGVSAAPVAAEADATALRWC